MDIPVSAKTSNKKLYALVITVTLSILTYFTWSTHSPAVNKSDLWTGVVKFGVMNIGISGRGELTFRQEHLLSTQVEGVISEIYVSPGQTVQKGARILKLVNIGLQDELEGSQTELAEYDKILNEQTAIARDKEIEKTLEIRLIEVDIDLQLRELNAVSALHESGIVSKLELHKEQAKLKRLKVRLDIEKQRQENLIKINAQKLSGHKLVYEKLRAKVHANRRRLGELTIRAEIDGMLIELDDKVKFGSHFNAGQYVGTVSDVNQPIVILRIPHYNSSSIAVGMNVALTINAAKYAGKVTRIEPQIINETMGVEVVFVGNTPSNIQNNMKVMGVVQITSLKDVLHIKKPVGAKANSSQTLYKINSNGDKLVRTIVQYGNESSQYIEINSGLKEEDIVVLSSMNEYIDFDDIKLL
jgi:multidrug efflux pump subunit AcrA (membrane-fusion protein)